MYRNLGLSRLLFALGSAIFLFGAAAHAKAFFGTANRIIDASAAKVFFAHELKVLWLADSTTLMGLAALFGLMAAKPRWAAKPLMLCLSWIPAATTALLYYFLGPFYAAHMLLAATLMVIIATLALPVNLTPPHRMRSASAVPPASPDELRR